MLRRTLLAGLAGTGLAYGQAEFRVYSEHPRLFLDSKRLRRLQRDVGRQTLRWRQFEFLIREQAPFPEPGFAFALYYRATGDESFGRRAIEAVLGRPEASLREGAIAFDWCYSLLSDAERATLTERLGAGAQAIAGRAGASLAEASAAALAAMAVAGDWANYENVLVELLGPRWDAEWAPQVTSGEAAWDPEARLGLWELAHAVRANLDRDLLMEHPSWSERAPLVSMLRNYPGSFEDQAGRYRLPAPLAPTNADLDAAAVNRVADMLAVAWDATPTNAQFLQGWIRHDAFQMGSPYGGPYEYLWVNPYLPGLSFSNAPNFVHDAARGAVFGRSDWTADAVWLGYFDGALRIYSGGRLDTIPAGTKQRPMVFGYSAVVLATAGGKYVTAFEDAEDHRNTVYLVGLDEGAKYRLKVQKLKAFTVLPERGGIIPLNNDPERKGDEIDFSRDVVVEIRRQG